MLLPNIYQKDIFTIDYQKLKKIGIKCLIFDLDNTLALISEKECPNNIKKLITKLKKDFKVLIISNNFENRLIPYSKALQIDYISLALKPLPIGLIKLKNKYHIKKKEMIMIGDQLVTDVFSGKLFGIKTALVEPLSLKDLKITGFNRYLENIILNKYEKQGKFKKGVYYNE